MPKSFGDGLKERVHSKNLQDKHIFCYLSQTPKKLNTKRVAIRKESQNKECCPTKIRNSKDYMNKQLLLKELPLNPGFSRSYKKVGTKKQKTSKLKKGRKFEPLELH